MTDSESLSYVRRALTEDLFGKMISKAQADEKLQFILADLQKLVYPIDKEDLKETNTKGD